jgi:hypothetical protein
MNKGLSQLIVVMFLMMMGIALTATAYFWSQGVVFAIYPNETQDIAYMRSRACLNIQEITMNKVVINNCGSVPLERFNLYINDISETLLPDLEKLNPGDVYEIPTSSHSGTVPVYITSDYAESPVIMHTYS